MTNVLITRGEMS